MPCEGKVDIDILLSRGFHQETAVLLGKSVSLFIADLTPPVLSIFAISLVANEEDGRAAGQWIYARNSHVGSGSKVIRFEMSYTAITPDLCARPEVRKLVNLGVSTIWSEIG